MKRQNGFDEGQNPINHTGILKDSFYTENNILNSPQIFKYLHFKIIDKYLKCLYFHTLYFQK